MTNASYVIESLERFADMIDEEAVPYSKDQEVRMFLLSILHDLGKALGVVIVFFVISGAYFLIMPTEEDKYLDQQMKMYPFGFHCTDEKDETVVMKFDMKSQIGLTTDDFVICKYSMKNALYKNGEKKPFGCEFVIEKNGQKKNIIVYVAEEKLSDFSEVRFEHSDDKDLICSVVNKKVLKTPQKIHCQFQMRRCL